jgi:hypothetical protein
LATGIQSWVRPASLLQLRACCCSRLGRKRMRFGPYGMRQRVHIRARQRASPYNVSRCLPIISGRDLLYCAPRRTVTRASLGPQTHQHHEQQGRSLVEKTCHLLQFRLRHRDAPKRSILAAVLLAGTRQVTRSQMLLDIIHTLFPLHRGLRPSQKLNLLPRYRLAQVRYTAHQLNLY